MVYDSKRKNAKGSLCIQGSPDGTSFDIERCKLRRQSDSAQQRWTHPYLRGPPAPTASAVKIGSNTRLEHGFWGLGFGDELTVSEYLDFRLIRLTLLSLDWTPYLPTCHPHPQKKIHNPQYIIIYPHLYWMSYLTLGLLWLSRFSGVLANTPSCIAAASIWPSASLGSSLPSIWSSVSPVDRWTSCHALPSCADMPKGPSRHPARAWDRSRGWPLQL